MAKVVVTGAQKFEQRIFHVQHEAMTAPFGGVGFTRPII